jgi:predicted component of type VI protein secretion system
LKSKEDRVEAIKRGNIQFKKLQFAVEDSLAQTKCRIKEDITKLQIKDDFTPVNVVNHIKEISSNVLFPR